MTVEIENSIDRATAQANFNQLLDEISEGQADKVVIQDDNTAAVIIKSGVRPLAPAKGIQATAYSR